MAALVRDEKGLSALEMALLLPLFILILVGGFEVWKLMMLKRALYIGAYQAARHLASIPQRRDAEANGYARLYITRELEGTGLYSTEMELSADAHLSAECITLCGGRPVRVHFTLAVPVQIPFFKYKGQTIFILSLSNERRKPSDRDGYYHTPCIDCPR